MILPRLGADIPRQLTCKATATRGKIAFASELIRAGMIAPDAWRGSVSQTIQEELGDWLTNEWDDTVGSYTEMVGICADWMRFWGISFGYTDDLAADGFYDMSARLGMPKRSAERLGGADTQEPLGGWMLFTSVHQQGQFVTVGNRTTLLRRVYGDAAYDALYVICGSIEHIVGIMAPTHHGMLEYAEDAGYTSQQEARDAGLLTLDVLAQYIPEELLDWGVNEKRLQASVKDDARAYDWMREVMHLARQMAHHRDTRTVHNHVGGFDGVFPAVPICVRWSNVDDMVAAFDDFNEMQSQSGVTDVPFIRCFDARLPGDYKWSVRDAVQIIGPTIRMLARGMRALMLLSDDQDTLRVRLGAGGGYAG